MGNVDLWYYGVIFKFIFLEKSFGFCFLNLGMGAHKEVTLRLAFLLPSVLAFETLDQASVACRGS